MLDNLRPISITNIVGKILEKYVCNFIQSHFDYHDIISPRQMGFRKGYSTLDAVTEVLIDLNYAMNVNEFSVCLFLDLKKAFDSVSHSILL